MKQQKPVNVGLIGLGTIGTGVARILLENKGNLARRAGRPVVLKTAADLYIDIDRGLDFGETTLTTDAMAMINDPDIDIVVEVIGGVNPAKKFIEAALRNKKHVVTSNKEVIAKHGPEFIDIAQENGVNIYYEAAVGGGIPIIHAMKNCLAANNMRKVYGIMNGTTNYILTKMSQEGAAFDEVLKEAQDKGFAEADPSNDVDGTDVAYKLAILASIAFNSQFSYEDIYHQGIRQISAADIKVARELGYVIKLLAIGIEHDPTTEGQPGEVELRVHPVMVEADHPLASVNGSFNAVYAVGDYIGETMFYGHGAGMLPTASAVMGDVLDIAMAAGQEGSHPSIDTRLTQKPVKAMGDIESEYFFNLRVLDQPGVLGAVSNICGNLGVSLKSVQQKESETTEADVMFITHTVREAAMQEALKQMSELPSVVAVTSAIRVGL